MLLCANVESVLGAVRKLAFAGALTSVVHGVLATHKVSATACGVGDALSIVPTRSRGLTFVAVAAHRHRKSAVSVELVGD